MNRLTVENYDGEEMSCLAKWQICDRCEGNAVHDHPAFSNGLGHDDFYGPDADPDFREQYMRGEQTIYLMDLPVYREELRKMPGAPCIHYHKGRPVLFVPVFSDDGAAWGALECALERKAIKSMRRALVPFHVTLRNGSGLP